LAVIGLVDPMKIADVERVRRRYGFGFIDETTFTFIVSYAIRHEEFEIYQAIWFGLPDFGDDAPSPSFRLLKDLVMGYCFSDEIYRSSKKHGVVIIKQIKKGVLPEIVFLC
jgi:hypothetical protein